MNSPEETHSTPEKAHTLYIQKTEWLARRRQWPTTHLGVTALAKHLVTWAAWTWEAHKMQVQLSLRLWGVLKNLNLSGLDLESARNPGPTSGSSWQSNLEPEKHRPWTGTNPVQLKYCEHSPQTPVVFVCSVPLSPQHDWTSEPK